LINKNAEEYINKNRIFAFISFVYRIKIVLFKMLLYRCGQSDKMRKSEIKEQKNKNRKTIAFYSILIINH